MHVTYGEKMIKNIDLYYKNKMIKEQLKVAN